MAKENWLIDSKNERLLFLDGKYVWTWDNQKMTIANYLEKYGKLEEQQEEKK